MQTSSIEIFENRGSCCAQDIFRPCASSFKPQRRN